MFCANRVAGYSKNKWFSGVDLQAYTKQNARYRHFKADILMSSECPNYLFFTSFITRFQKKKVLTG